MKLQTAMELGRVSNLPTVWSNCLAGALLANATLAPPLLAWIMLAISLGVIMAVNYGTEEVQGGKGTRGQGGRGDVSDFIWKFVALLVDRKIGNNPQKSIDYPVPKTKIELFVEIQKQLPGFFLDVTFNTDQTPLGILGGSGAGKSLILRCIAGLDTPDRGRIVLNGRRLNSHLRQATARNYRSFDSQKYFLV